MRGSAAHTKPASTIIKWYYKDYRDRLLEETYTNVDYDPRTKKTTLKSIPAKQ
jgi:uncharacterized protein YqkB